MSGFLLGNCWFCRGTDHERSVPGRPEFKIKVIFSIISQIYIYYYWFIV